uniref:Tail protein n=1 Tax=Pseudomonas phage Touem01 TaxID=3138548 RepID=A0AAU6W2B6_9VIRU
MIFFCPHDSAFYDQEIVGDAVPEGSVEISKELYLELQAGYSEGMDIKADKKGFPFLADRPGPTKDEQAASARFWRDNRLTATDALVTRHRDEIEQELKTSLSSVKYGELQVYRQSLRDWSSVAEFPDLSSVPINPKWLKI